MALVFAFALVLEAFVPMLASAAAALQGIPVGQVCPVYGVALAPATSDAAPWAAADAGQADYADHSGHSGHSGHAGHDHGAHARPAGSGEPAPDPRHDGSTHAGDHCALAGWVAFAKGGDPGAGPLPRDAGASCGGPAAGAVPARHDALARWAALVAHAPPRLRSV